ncbi:hypothetical protein WDZ92_43365, partial [Nostoc sp. NIES-2111]
MTVGPRGGWGVVPYREDDKKQRTPNEEGAQRCYHYDIVKDAPGGVVMKLADEEERPAVLVEKAAGRTIVGGQGAPPGGG